MMFRYAVALLTASTATTCVTSFVSTQQAAFVSPSSSMRCTSNTAIRMSYLENLNNNDNAPVAPVAAPEADPEQLSSFSSVSTLPSPPPATPSTGAVTATMPPPLSTATTTAIMDAGIASNVETAHRPQALGDSAIPMPRGESIGPMYDLESDGVPEYSYAKRLDADVINRETIGPNYENEGGFNADSAIPEYRQLDADVINRDTIGPNYENQGGNRNNNDSTSAPSYRQLDANIINRDTIGPNYDMEN